MAQGAVITVNKGENFIVRRLLKDKNGSPITVVSCNSIAVVIRQKGVVKATLTYPSANIRVNNAISTNCLEIEVVTTVSDTFDNGDISFTTTITATDTDFVTGIYQKKIEERIFAVVE